MKEDILNKNNFKEDLIVELSDEVRTNTNYLSNRYTKFINNKGILGGYDESDNTVIVKWTDNARVGYGDDPNWDWYSLDELRIVSTTYEEIFEKLDKLESKLNV